MQKLIYIAAPYTKGDVAVNVRKAIDAADELASAELVPFCPHLYHFWHLIHPHDYEFWTGLDMKWVALCNALVRLPGESSGADEEVEEANRLVIPVFFNTQDCINWYG